MEKNQAEREVLAFGDSGLTIPFSRTTISALECTQLMLQLRDQVEKHSWCTYNFALLNLYPNGSNNVCSYKDNKIDLVEFGWFLLSFGAKRTLEFKRPNCPEVRIDLEHGSMYSCWSLHVEFSDIKQSKISLTFRRKFSNSASLKKQRGNFSLLHQMKLPH